MVPPGLSRRSGSALIEGASLLVALVVLAQCAGSTGAPVPSPGMETDTATPTPTPAAYWDLQPLTSQPDGGWKTYRNEELRLAFEYPAMYDGMDCGRLLLFEKVYDDSACTVVGFGAIRVHVWEDWAGDVAERVAAFQSGPEIQNLTAMEPFSIDGVPAFRYIFALPRQADLVYAKNAFAAFGGRLYEFSYERMLVSSLQCDAPPLSQEEVYEHLLSTFEFDD